MTVITACLDTIKAMIAAIRDGESDFPERSDLDFVRRLIDKLDMGDIEDSDRATITRIIDFIDYAPGTLRPYTYVELLGDIETILES